MGKYRIKIKLLTEAIFGSGNSIPSSVDLEITHDEYGFPFMKAKTFKGNFRKAVTNVAELLSPGECKAVIDNLLGKENDGVNSWKNIRFTDCMLNENVREILAFKVRNGTLTESEIKEALTDIRSFTSIDDNGSYEEGSLRDIRVIKKGLEFYVDLNVYRELSEKELGLLATACRYMKHIGSMKTRGKGEVDCSFLVCEEGKYADKTDVFMNKFLKGVKANG
jgi:CRISPR-associated protein Csx10